ncbi:MAG: pyridoxine 5'-phosphate synthase [Myxococcales bacterium]|nr:pyridoxine 5'-phosphate synthase [Myxococcales bacterium]
MVRLSVNLNKIATVRNSRGGVIPDVVEAAKVCVGAGAHGITVHPRTDQRHIRPDDVRALAAYLRTQSGVEFNVEGDSRPDLIDLVQEVQPKQYTLVPVIDNEVTSQGRWPEHTDDNSLRGVIRKLHDLGIRVSVFIDAQPDAVRWASHLGVDRVELYTEPFAAAFTDGRESADQMFTSFREVAKVAHELGLGINAGHDLDLKNLILFCHLPHLLEVSIGHALISQALFDGLDATVKAYLDVLASSRDESDNVPP